MESIRVALAEIEERLSVVCEVAVRTPTVRFGGDEPYLKLENLQRLGVFKIRGTWNRVPRLSDEERRRGLTTISSGNHGLSLAWAAKRLGIPCVVRVPEGAVARKVEAIRSPGAEVEPMPRAMLVLFHEEERWREWPQMFIHPFAHPHTIAGAGTLGWEIAEDVPDVRTVLVPVGGGGLVSGVAIAVKGRLPNAKVYGVQAEGAAPLPVTLRTGSAHSIEKPQTIADGIGVGLVVFLWSEDMCPVIPNVWGLCGLAIVFLGVAVIGGVLWGRRMVRGGWRRGAEGWDEGWGREPPMP